MNVDLKSNEEYLNDEIDPKDVETLLTMVQPGDTIYSVTRYVNYSRTYSYVSFLVFPVADGKAQLRDLTIVMQKILGKGYKLIDEPGTPYAIKLGTGYGDAFSVIYNLGKKVFQSSPGNDSGYAFNHKWI